MKASPRQSAALAVIGAGCALLSAALFLIWRGSPQTLEPPSLPAFAPAQVRFPAPRLTSATDLNGESVSLEKYRGSVVLVNLWATWCPPCRAEMPELEAFYQKYKTDGFVVVAIDQRESREEVAAFMAERRLTFPVWLDPHGEAEEKFNTNALPSSYVLDRDGQVRLMWTGGVSQAELEAHLPTIIYESQE